MLLMAIVLSLSGAAVGAYRGWSQGGVLVAIFGLIGGFISGVGIGGIAFVIWEGRAAIGRGIVFLFLAACVLVFIHLMQGYPLP
jgi:hypothetical protein